MTNPKILKTGKQQLSANVFFIDIYDDDIRPIYQRDNETGECSYRVYPDRGNTKENQKTVYCYKQLAQLLIQGHSVRCRLKDGNSSNRSLSSADIKSLHIEIENEKNCTEG